MTEKTNPDTINIEDLPSDIVQSTLPFLSPNDLKNLSLTNKYFHNLLSQDESTTVWHELFHKVFGTQHTNDEPFQSKNSEEYKSVSETICINTYPDLNWHERFRKRSHDSAFYTWGCLKHSRLGYTANSNPNLLQSNINNVGISSKFGVNKPTKVPWFNNDPTADRTTSISPQNSVVQISSGGFSFQILTSSGKIYSTGSTFTGGHKGPGPLDLDHDYDPFRDFISHMESSFPRLRVPGRGLVNTTGSFNIQRISPTTTSNASIGEPHPNIYQKLEEIEKYSSQYIPNNDHIRRMFTSNCFAAFQVEDVATFFDEKNAPKFIAISSGRSHFIGLTDQNVLFSWDSPTSDFGAKIEFKDLPSRETNPILKIGCGWNFSCIYIYNIGLVVWSSRSSIQKGITESFANYKIIPNTSELSGDNKILDFACLQDNTVLYITTSGKQIYLYKDGQTITLDLDIKGRLLKITSCFSLITIFTDQHSYMLKVSNGTIDYTSLSSLDLDIQGETIISLAAGDYHTIGLSQRGNIYTWGTESQQCGCLGLGAPEYIVTQAMLGETEGRRNIKVLKPTKVELEEGYKCIGITGGGWHSGAILIKK
ncbi:hypothetical protein TBLA_0C02630 [Henningerozyma blattae CBS 6284]|uniref:F-box domain-containing protein n=1 Tax=Henningerozyma blattae (strain ATCC 34711 / CBS 6284 / DSM 70876 / NBRC 10599 / NRRL Y-10934 / UCD 77-7) TaxID=1071380 RepID=I2H120_HENB6|nr:hypothetical protein TBLA_0C02630 [Tetrapisispora blattae CBS 6284]CCH60072.1 hypothetical protein TBLA_0C02630 [Tetrapisispora blattae CBS 6284]